MASKGLYSHAGTCLSAAACTTIVTPARALSKREASRTSPRKYRNVGSSNPEARMSCCLSSSRLKITRRFGWYCFSMISTNFLPKDPVPPVTKTACSDQFIPPRLGSTFEFTPSHQFRPRGSVFSQRSIVNENAVRSQSLSASISDVPENQAVVHQNVTRSSENFVTKFSPSDAKMAGELPVHCLE